MPKAEKGSLKDLGKRIKAKGLQKLKFYCQMCEKQCRDANGFKCHLTSESHLRQMKIFSENAQTFMDRYSKEFEKIFLDTLRMRHSTARVNANNVYQEVIRDKAHIHMNATIWATLTDFCKYLEKTGKCVVEETERGWFITYIERDVAKLEREERLRQRQEAETMAEITAQQNLERQRIEAAKALDRAGGVVHVQPTQLQRNEDGDDEKNSGTSIQLNVKLADTKKKSNRLAMDEKPSIFGGEESDTDDQEDEGSPSLQNSNLKKNRSGADLQDSTKRKHESDNLTIHSKPAKMSKKETDDKSWLLRDILVRIVNKDIQPYYKCKAVVDKVDGFTAEVAIMDEKNSELDGDVLRIDQDDLETVVPKRPDEKVRIVRGPHRGRKGVAIHLDKQKYKAVIEFKDGTKLQNVDYDDFSKLA